MRWPASSMGSPPLESLQFWAKRQRMAKARYVLSIDQGTTGNHVSVVNSKVQVVGRAYQEFTQHFPKPGWVEHDLEEIWKSVERTIKKALENARIKPTDVVAIGITNQ